MSSKDDSEDGEYDEEAIAKASKEARYPMSRAIPDEEDIFEAVDNEDDFVRSRAPSPSSIGAGYQYRVDSVAVPAAKKRGAFFSQYDYSKRASQIRDMLGSDLN